MHNYEIKGFFKDLKPEQLKKGKDIFLPIAISIVEFFGYEVKEAYNGDEFKQTKTIPSTIIPSYDKEWKNKFQNKIQIGINIRKNEQPTHSTPDSTIPGAERLNSEGSRSEELQKTSDRNPGKVRGFFINCCKSIQKRFTYNGLSKQQGRGGVLLKSDYNLF